MKLILLSIVASLFYVVSFAQPNSLRSADSAASGNRFHYTPASTDSKNNSLQARKYHDKQMQPVGYNQFLHELIKIKSLSNSYSRQVAAKRMANKYLLTSMQVAELSNTLRGYGRLDVAQYYYTKCLDPYNYDVVFNDLSYDMGNELNDYINYIEGSYNEDEQYDYDPYNNGYKPMPAEAFSSAKQTISNAAFENTRLETAKTITANNHITTDQVIEVCRLFSFEASKLAFAQFAYQNTTDQHNYFKVNNVFDFDASRMTLDQFTRNGEK